MFSTNLCHRFLGILMGQQWILRVLPFLLIAAATEAQISWGQIGKDIDGEAAGDASGHSISLSANGMRVAIGATDNDGKGSNSGHVRVYQWNGNAWMQLGADIEGDAAGDNFGGAVYLSADGTRLAVGASGNDGVTGTNSGHVRVFRWDGVSWVQLGADIDGESAYDSFGMVVSLSSDGTRMAAGTLFNSGNGSHSGHVRVYQWNGNAWMQLGADIDGEAGDQSAASMSLSSDGVRVAIGAPANDGGKGRVRVYQWNGSAWGLMGAGITGERAGDVSGYAVSLSSDGRRVAIGAPENDGKGSDSGHARVYQWNGSTWVQLGTDLDGEAAGDQCGYAVSLSTDGMRVAISAIANDGKGSNSGHVRVYQWNGSAWIQLGADIDGERSGDFSGLSVALSAEGTWVAIGAPPNSDNGLKSGHVRVYGACPTVPVACTSPTVNVTVTNIHLFPNPTTGMLQLNNVQPDRVMIYDNLGHLMLDVEKPTTMLNMTMLPTGIYFLKALQDKTVYVARVVKE